MSTHEKCKHEHITASDEFRGFASPVYVEPHTHENRAAHGGISYVQTCDSCGAERRVLQNQRHFEFGPWGPDRATRTRLERERQERERREREAAEDKALATAGIKVLDYDSGMRDAYGELATQPQICVEIRGQRQWLAEWRAKEAAEQRDNGDGLVPCYRAINRQAQELEFSRLAAK